MNNNDNIDLFSEYKNIVIKHSDLEKLNELFKDFRELNNKDYLTITFVKKHS